MTTAEATELSPRWTQLRTTPTIDALWLSPHRFNVVPAGRRSLKTETRKRKTVIRALRGSDYGAGRYVLAAPTYAQAKRIFWDDLKALSPGWALACKPSESELTVRYVNGSEVAVVGMDKPERIEGSPLDGIVLDEYGNMKADTWGAHIRPALSDRLGWADMIGVPEGRNHYYDMAMAAKAMMAELGAESEWGFYTWPSLDVLPESEVEAAKRDLDELTFQQEYEGSFVNFTGRAYYCFGDHNQRPLEYKPELTLGVCLDFNVEPGVAVMVQEQMIEGSSSTCAIGEVHIPTDSNTPAVCRKIIDDFGEHTGPVILYADATGGARGTAKVSGSDLDIAAKMLREKFGKRFSARVPPANPRERARVNAVNTRCRSASGEVRLYVDPVRCPHLVRDLEGVRMLEGGSGEINKKHDMRLTHASDALGYYVVREFPINTVDITSEPFHWM